MITKFFSKIEVRFNPRHIKPAKLSRAFLASIPAQSRNALVISHKVLTNKDLQPPEISVTFKDGNTVTVDFRSTKTTKDMTETFDRYSRLLQIKEDIAE